MPIVTIDGNAVEILDADYNKLCRFQMEPGYIIKSIDISMTGSTNSFCPTELKAVFNDDSSLTLDIWVGCGGVEIEVYKILRDDIRKGIVWSLYTNIDLYDVHMEEGTGILNSLNEGNII